MFSLRHFALGLLLCPTGIEPTLTFPHSNSNYATSNEDEEFEELLRVFNQIKISGSLAERGEALLALFAIGEPLALPEIAKEYRKVYLERDEVDLEIQKIQVEITHRRRLLGDLEQRAQSARTDLDDTIKSQEKRLEDLQSKLEWSTDKKSNLEPWLDLLESELTEFAPTIDSSTRKRLEKQVWKDIELGTKIGERLANIALLGHIGATGTAVQMQKSIVKYVKDRVKLDKTLGQQMRNVIKMEQQLQDEADRNNGGGSFSFLSQYNQIKIEAFETQALINELVNLGTACASAGASALRRESDSDLAKSVKVLMRSQAKGDNGAQRLTIGLLGASGLPDVRKLMLEELIEQEDPLVTANLITALANPAFEGEWDGLEDFLLKKGLKHQTWLVKARSAQTLAKIRSRKAIPILIPMLASEKGRVRDDFEAALNSLTGLTFRGKTVLWHRWWKEHEATFVIPTEAEALADLTAESDKRRTGSGFFGIESSSERILFVIDLSGSMQFSMVPRENPDDDLSGGRQPDMPEEGENSRIEEAIIALHSSLGDQEIGGVFNLIYYASSVWSWKDKLAQVTESNIADAQDSLKDLKAGGRTNIYGALKFAFDMARATSKDNWYEPRIDTIFFLSDGRASVGLVTDADKILAYVRERNSSAGIAINVVGLSGAQDAYLLQRLALENGGKYVSR